MISFIARWGHNVLLIAMGLLTVTIVLMMR